MGDWVAFLRGVNVGGITIRSAPLREVFIGLGLDDARTEIGRAHV